MVKDVSTGTSTSIYTTPSAAKGPSTTPVPGYRALPEITRTLAPESVTAAGMDAPFRFL
jgi:hypothetical protein